jgi:hypothetical protein
MVNDTESYFYIGLTSILVGFIITICKICFSSRCDSVQTPLFSIHRNVQLENNETNLNNILNKNKDDLNLNV